MHGIVALSVATYIIKGGLIMQRSYKGSKFTFDSFEITKENSKAFERAKQFTENADSKPLAIFGSTATGKTHLLYAVKNAI